MGRRCEALEMIDEAVENGLDEPHLLSVKASILMDDSRPEQALECINTMIKNDPTNHNMLCNIAELLVKMRDHTGAGILLNNLLEANPADEDAARIRAMMGPVPVPKQGAVPRPS